MHSRTTAREIIEAFAGERLDYWVTGYDTGGTLKGVARVPRHGAAGYENRRVRVGRRAGGYKRTAGDICRGASGLQRRPKSASVLCMLPDTGERYLSTPLCRRSGRHDELEAMQE
jgi:cysteine synthase